MIYDYSFQFVFTILDASLVGVGRVWGDNAAAYKLGMYKKKSALKTYPNVPTTHMLISVFVSTVNFASPKSETWNENRPLNLKGT